MIYKLPMLPKQKRIPRVYEWGLRYSSSPDRPLMDVSQGVPRISPPKFVQDALGIASSSPESFGYSRWDGEVSMRQSLVQEMKFVYGVDANLSMDDVALTAGCNQAFVVAVMALANAGDEIILPVPWLVFFPTFIRGQLILLRWSGISTISK